MNKKQIITIHILFWFIVISMTFSFMIFGSQPFSYDQLISRSCKMMLEIIDFYIIYSIIVPRFYIKKTYLKFFIITVIYILCYIPLYAYSMNYTEILLGGVKDFQYIKSYFLVAIYYTILYIFLGGLFKLAIEGNKSQQQKILLEKQNVKSELALLRSQVNPHFLFNILNTIHSFVKSNPDKATHSIIKLSDIMRFILYDATHDKISLNKEIEYLHDYITLQKFRLDNPGFVQFEINGNPNTISIPPMLLIPFVENAFKHGKIKTPSPGIKIKLNIIENKKIEFNVENVTSSLNLHKIENSEGIGLKNVKRRLELLFPDNHDLKIIETGNRFLVHLSLNLT